jgi:hypothetical protein
VDAALSFNKCGGFTNQAFLRFVTRFISALFRNLVWVFLSEAFSHDRTLRLLLGCQVLTCLARAEISNALVNRMHP